MTWGMQGLQQLMCGLRGHHTVRHFERNRLSLQCLSCGHQTPGWILRDPVVVRLARREATGAATHIEALPGTRSLLHLTS